MSGHSDIIWNILSSLAVILAVIATYLKNRSNHNVTTNKIDAVQDAVNGNNKVLTDRVDQLGHSLKAAGVPIPDKPQVIE